MQVVKFFRLSVNAGYLWLVDDVIGRVLVLVGVLAFFGVSVAVPLLSSAPPWLAVPAALVIVLIVFVIGAYRLWDAEVGAREGAEATVAKMQGVIDGWVNNQEAAQPVPPLRATSVAAIMIEDSTDVHVSGNRAYGSPVASFVRSTDVHAWDNESYPAPPVAAPAPEPGVDA